MKIAALVSLPQDKKALLPLHILDTLEQEASQYDPTARFRLVGGCVRDTLLGRKPKDFDIVTSTTSSVLEQMGLENVGKAFPVYLYKDPQYGQMEIAVARSEEKTGPGHKGFDTVPTGNFDDDMIRRDLTINALSVDSNGSLHGPDQAMEQIEKKILQNVSEKFSEDPLRVFRVARFSAQFGSGWTVSETLKEQMRKIQHELNTLPADRVREEFRKALAGPEPLNFFETLRAGGCVDPWFSEVHQNWDALAMVCDYGRDAGWSFEQFLVGIGADMATPDSLMNRLGISDQVKKAVHYVKSNRSKLQAAKQQPPQEIVRLVQSGGRGVLDFDQILDCALRAQYNESKRYLLNCQAAIKEADMTGVKGREDAMERMVGAISKVAAPLISETPDVPQFLYHGTSLPNALSILKFDSLAGGIHWGRAEEPHGPRLSSYVDEAWKFAEYTTSDSAYMMVMFKLDGKKLAQDYKVVEYLDVDHWGDPWPGEKEEFVPVTGRVTPLSKYILDIKWRWIDEAPPSKEEEMKWLDESMEDIANISKSEYTKLYKMLTTKYKMGSEKTAIPLPSEKIKSRTYWHGTVSKKFAESIVREGIRPSSELDPHLYINDESITPQEGRIYMGKLDVALEYAAGASGHPIDQDNTRYLFKIDGTQLINDCEPDEDFVGALGYRYAGYTMHDLNLQPTDYDMFKEVFVAPVRNLTFLHAAISAAEVDAEDEDESLFQDDPTWADFVHTGNRIMQFLDDSEKVRIIESFNTPVAHQGAIKPVAGWAVPYKDLFNIKSEADLNKFGNRIL